MCLECKGQGIRASASVRLPNWMGLGQRVPAVEEGE